MAPTEVVNRLYIGDVEDAVRYSDEFEQIVSLCPLRDDAEFEPTAHHPLTDGRNEQSHFDHAVESTMIAMDKDGDTLVHCAMGVSRSATIIITAIAQRNDLTWIDSRDIVWREKPGIAPHPELIKHAKEYLGEDESAYKNPF